MLLADSGRGASSSSSRPGSQVIAPADDNSSVCVMQRVGESSGEHTGDKDANSKHSSVLIVVV